METFFRNEDYETYIDLVANACPEAGTEVWAYCRKFSISPGRKRVGRYKTRGEYDPCTLGCGIPAADGLVSAHPLPASTHVLPAVIELLGIFVGITTSLYMVQGECLRSTFLDALILIGTNHRIQH